MVAALATSAVLWLLVDGIFPTVESAIDRLPATAELRAATLLWQGDDPVLLGEGKFLAFTVDLDHGGALRSPADFQFELGKKSVRVFSLLGESEFPYPSEYTIALTRAAGRAAWGAWSPEILGAVALGTFFGLLLVWAALATIYFLPVRLVCFFTNRDVGMAASWKMAGAALLPGALVLTLFVLAYDFGFCDLVQLGFAFGMHLVTGWIYLFVSPLFLNRAEAPAKTNPFHKK